MGYLGTFRSFFAQCLSCFLYFSLEHERRFSVQREDEQKPDRSSSPPELEHDSLPETRLNKVYPTARASRTRLLTDKT